ncbi:MAG: YraN family protein [Castellaniella sp.]|uniref:YraN family protein n=1 Tax=Castellaniella sp. TaxID=1955812 RepID=UPI003C793F87
MPTDPYARAQAAQDLARRRRRRALRAAARRSRPPAALNTSPATAGSATQRQGYAAEDLAARYLATLGIAALARNLRCKAGEIDLVAREGAVLVFIEVRQRRNQHHGGAAASVNRAKQARLIRAARYFLPALTRLHFQGRPPPCRFDVVCIEGVRIDWIRDAFQLE